MSVNGFSVGNDITVAINTATGPLVMNLITSFKRKQDTTTQKIKGMDGVTRHVRFQDGWAGSFNVERTDGTLDAYFAQQEANFYAGINEGAGIITETIREPNGSISQYRYTGVLLSYDDAGDSEGDKTIKQVVGFVASRRLKVV